MKMLKKGPEIKLPSLKAPDFLADVYYDLRERHLLPLAVILVVAIAAVPIALGKSSETEGSSAAIIEGAVAGTSSATAQPGQLVAKSAPGLREYQRRLDDLQERDPFRQQFQPSEESGSEGAGESADGGSSYSTAESSTGSGAPSTSGTGGTSETDGTPVTSELTYFSYAIDVRVTPGGSQSDGGSDGSAPKPTVRRKLPELTMLPSRETPAAIFMGATKDAKKALFLISSDVEGIFGDGKCVLGSQRCELLMLEPGVPETFVYGGAGRTFKIELLKIELVETDELNRAPLGEPKKKRKQGE